MHILIVKIKIGDFYYGERTGKGTYYAPNGDRYTGDFSNGQMHGNGVLTFYDGAKYDGAFNRGQMHGYGSFYDRSGKLVFRGNWRNNDPQ
jgi:hypothetical protein